MIPAETRYDTYDGELLAILETFKTWKYYPKSSHHDVLMLTNHNNLWQFIDTKNLSSKQVRWAQKLFCYHFQIDYCQNKANGGVNALSQYSQWSVKEEETFWAKNIKIFYHLQLSLAKVSKDLENSQFSKTIRRLGWLRECLAWTEEYHVICHILILYD